MRDRLQRSGSQAGYDRTCTKLSEEEVARRVRAKEPHVIRLDVSTPPTAWYVASTLSPSFDEVKNSLRSLISYLEMSEMPKRLSLRIPCFSSLMGFQHITLHLSWTTIRWGSRMYYVGRYVLNPPVVSYEPF